MLQRNRVKTYLCPPAPSLKKYFYSYIFINGSDLSEHQHIPSSSCSAIIINHGDPVEIIDNKNNRNILPQGVYFKGIQLDPIKFGKNISNISITVILIRPESTGIFLNEDAEYYTSRFSNEPEITRCPEMESLPSQLVSCLKISQKGDIINNNLRKFFSRTPEPPTNDLISKINHIVTKFQGSIQAGDLTTLTEVHARSLRRKTIQSLGVSPYQYIRLIRTEFVLASLLYSKAESIQDIVYEFGFFDQSHLIHDLKKYILCSPLDLLTHSQNISIYKKILKTRVYT